MGGRKSVQVMLRLSAVAVFLLAFAVGCMNVEYVGQRFPAREAGETVRIFEARSELPPGEYVIIGKMTVEAPSGYSMIDIRARLMDEAHSRGADALHIVSAGKARLGQYYREPNAVGAPESVRTTGTYDEGDFGEVISLQAGELDGGHRKVVRAFLLMKRDRYGVLNHDREEQKRIRQEKAAEKRRAALEARQRMDKAEEAASDVP